MDKKYKTTKATISFIKYNMVFCTRCNRKIFKNDMVKKIFISECKLVCEYLDAKITEIDFFDYYVHMIIESNPKYSANDIIQKIKSHTSKVIREKVVELNKLPSLWTREYLVTTESELEEGLMNSFLEKQKK